MLFPSEFFSLNLAFARKVSQVSDLTLEDALLKHTHFYWSLNLGRDFDADNPVWRACLAGMKDTRFDSEWIYAFYRQRLAAAPKSLPALEFGCFYYEVWNGGRVRLHFRNNDPPFSPLCLDRLNLRQRELAALFQHVRQAVPEARSVVGGSWLYNLEAYRRLFPPVFLATAKVGTDPETRFIMLWGQFLDHHGQVKPDLARCFLDGLERAQSLTEALDCFPFHVLRLEGPIEEFFDKFAHFPDSMVCRHNKNV